MTITITNTIMTMSMTITTIIMTTSIITITTMITTSMAAPAPARAALPSASIPPRKS